MAGIETVYKGRTYRSLLEARWAAFFDLAGWRNEYEPYELNGWIPDFSILGVERWSIEDEPASKETAEILVEVKPYSKLKEFDTGKILGAIENTDKWGKEILLLGMSLCWEVTSTALDVGWLGEHMTDGGYHFASAPFVWFGQGKGNLGFYHANCSWHNRITGEYTGNYTMMYPDEIKRLWNLAGDMIRWQPRAREVAE